MPPLPPDEALEVIAGIDAARATLDRFERERERAESERGLDAMPFNEVDLWTRAIRAALGDAASPARRWLDLCADIEAGP